MPLRSDAHNFCRENLLNRIFTRGTLSDLSGESEMNFLAYNDLGAAV